MRDRSYEYRASFIGTAGIPNRYGGFESFLERCAPALVALGWEISVTCDSKYYRDRGQFHGVDRLFIPVPANGALSTVHDLLAFLAVLRRSRCIVVLGVSGGLWFPFFRAVCFASRKRLFVNVDGIEWRRTKFSRSRRLLLRMFDALAQVCAERVIYDNEALYPYLLPSGKRKAVRIAYPGDHVLQRRRTSPQVGHALTICRIEPENNIDMLIGGFLDSNLSSYTIVGNWSNSRYGRTLRNRWASEARLSLRDPVYDPIELDSLRSSSEFYLHGHAVGGTNPSLVEMLYYDTKILCFDCEFNRSTAGDAVGYFSTREDLAEALRSTPWPEEVIRNQVRSRYTVQAVANDYDLLMRG